MMQTHTLYRPVGLTEMELIVASNWKKFPPRLDWQPIFYPVLNQQYAEQIALEWNTKDAFSSYCGIVTAFEIDKTYYHSFDVQNVGGDIHNELWVPSESLETFNANIIGDISIANAFFGKDFEMSFNVELNKALHPFIQRPLKA